METIETIEASGQVMQKGIEQSEVNVDIGDTTVWNDLGVGQVNIQQGNDARITIEAQDIEEVIGALQQALAEYSSVRSKDKPNGMFGDPLADFPSIR